MVAYVFMCIEQKWARKMMTVDAEGVDVGLEAGIPKKVILRREKQKIS